MKDFKILLAYIKESLIAILCLLLAALAADMVLVTSSQLEKSLPDIIYLNILVAAIALVMGAAGFIRFRARYLRLKDALDKKEYSDYLLPEKGFIPQLLQKLAGIKNEECQKSTANLQKSLDELNDYITRWVHEIKIPVSVCELIVENAVTDTDNSGNLRIELERVKFLINQVLYAAKASRYDKDLSISEFNLSRTVNEAVKRNSVFYIHKNIEVVKGFLDFNILNDEKWVSYILDQILNNAGKYTGQNGRLEIGADDDEKSVMLHIRDNGTGIAANDLGRIFDKGFTGENVRHMTKSTGMGLYYSKAMADMLGIGLEAYSEPGVYTEFTLIFKKINDILR